MRILYIAGTELFAAHGGSVHTWAVATELARRGHDVALIAAKTRGKRHARRPPENLSVFEVNMSVGGIMMPITALPPAIRTIRRRPHVIIERLAVPGGAGAIISRLRNAPLMLEVVGPAPHLEMVLSRHGVARLPLARQMLGRWLRFQYEQSSVVVTSNPRSVPQWFRGRVGVIDHGADVKRFSPAARLMPETASLKTRLNLAGKYVVFFAGAFMNWQGFGILPAVIERVCRENRNAVFLLAGSGEESAAFREAVGAKGLLERVIMPGSVSPEMLPYYAACADVGIAPYQPTSESKDFFFGSPLKVFEYMAAGLPVVATNCPPLDRIIVDGESGFTVPPNDATAFAEAILNIAAQPELSREMGQRNRAVAVANYSWDKHVDRVESLLDEISLRTRR